MPSRFDLDIPDSQVNFGAADIRALLEFGGTTVNLPDGTDVTLTTVSAYRQGADGYVITARAEGLVSTITTRNRHFFATVATRRGVYRLQSLPHNTTQARIVAHRTLDQRTLHTPRDYVDVPAHRFHHD